MFRKSSLLIAFFPLLFTLYFTLNPGLNAVNQAQVSHIQLAQSVATASPTISASATNQATQATAEEPHKKFVPVDQNYSLVALAIILVVIILLGVFLYGWK